MASLFRSAVGPLVAVVLLAAHPTGAAQLATQPADFLQPGTQPAPAELEFLDSAVCAQCHAGYRASDDEPSEAWAASMMAQSARDPLMRAALAIANADAAGSGETCIRCHAPFGWLEGRSTGGDLSALEPGDLDGVSCNFCHRLVDPIARADAPGADAAILAALDLAGTRPMGRCAGNAAQACAADTECGAAGPCAVQAGQGRFVVDPDESRRAPRLIPAHLHTTTASPYHARSEACAPCHDVSTPTFTRQPDGSWTLNDLGAPHPTQDPNQMFPEQRTYSEWRASAFASGGVVFADGRFGGAKTAMLPNTVPVSTCQDCHMPDVAQKTCEQGPIRQDAGVHYFAGANTWVLGAVLDEYGDESGLTEAAVTAARARTAAMLQAASDLEVTQAGYRLTVRVRNETGHKLPTGYPEGRRMWLGVRFFTGDTQIAEDGAYDDALATLDVPNTTKIYEAKQVIAADVAAASGLAVGTPFHLVLNGAVAFDNRIPPRGYTDAAFAAFGGAPVGQAYADGQHWDDTEYAIPLAATRVEVSLYYQTTTREYAEFLRDGAPDATGQNAYDRWVARGRSTPVVMDRVTQDLTPICSPDDAPCDDADACTTGDVCVAGACTGMSVPCADDGNACTDDVCDSTTGTCGVPRAGACDDGNACTTADVCADAVCAGVITDPAAFRCELDRLGAADVCAEPLPRSLRRVLQQQRKKLRGLATTVERRQAKGKSTEKPLAAMGRLLGKLQGRIDAAAASSKPARRITDACAASLGGIVARERSGLANLGG